MARVFERYKWLADLIQRSNGITLAEIQRAWDRSSLNDDGKPLTERTFHRHKEQIENAFNITIKCHKNSNRYYIENGDEVSEGGVTDWMLSTIAVDNMLNESRDLRDRIQFESIPGGQRHLSTIINAMREGVVLNMKYRSFWSDSDLDTTINPYFLKVFEQRWYVIGPTANHPRDPHTYALDRIKELTPSDKKFKYPKTFSPEGYYYNCYGIFHSDGKPEKIKLKVSSYQALYFDSLPIHRSQRKVDEECTEDYSLYEYYMAPTFDFIQFLCSKGASIEVLESDNLREAVADEIKKMYNTYFK